MCSLCVYNDLYELDRFVRAHVLHNDKLMYQRRRYQQQQRRQQQKKVLIPWKKNFIFCGGLHSGKMQNIPSRLPILFIEEGVVLPGASVRFKISSPNG